MNSDNNDQKTKEAPTTSQSQQNSSDPSGSRSPYKRLHRGKTSRRNYNTKRRDEFRSAKGTSELAALQQELRKSLFVSDPEVEELEKMILLLNNNNSSPSSRIMRPEISNNIFTVPVTSPCHVKPDPDTLQTDSFQINSGTNVTSAFRRSHSDILDVHSQPLHDTMAMDSPVDRSVLHSLGFPASPLFSSLGFPASLPFSAIPEKPHLEPTSPSQCEERSPCLVLAQEEFVAKSLLSTQEANGELCMTTNHPAIVVAAHAASLAILTLGISGETLRRQISPSDRTENHLHQLTSEMLRAIANLCAFEAHGDIHRWTHSISFDPGGMDQNHASHSRVRRPALQTFHVRLQPMPIPTVGPIPLSSSLRGIKCIAIATH